MEIDLDVRGARLQHPRTPCDAQSLKLPEGQDAGPLAAFDLLKRDQRMAQRDVIPCRLQIDPIAELIEKLSGLRSLRVRQSLRLLIRFLHRRALLILWLMA